MLFRSKVMSKKFVVVALSLMALAGCASYPEPVRIADNVALTSYENATQQNIDFGTARWSGVIAEISNQTNQTRLEIVYFPSGSNGRPSVSDQTQGRFVTYIKGFLDPMVDQGESTSLNIDQGSNLIESLLGEDRLNRARGDGSKKSR